MSAAVRWVALGVFACLLIGAFGLPVAGAVRADPGRAIFHGRGISASQSTNWGGYAVTTARGAVTDVKGSWVEPSIQGTCGSKNAYAAFWVGIDGYSSSSVEQTGTDSDCQGGSATYYAWYEFYPKPSHLFSLTISSGDTISAEVHFASGTFTVTLKDVTTGHSASASIKLKAARNSAEWIAEAPSGSSGILPLADFGTVHFGTDATSVASTCYATISGTTAAFGTFPNIHQITMVNNAGTADKAVPSSISSDHTSFNVTWKSAGP
jgi:hypothetical protein